MILRTYTELNERHVSACLIHAIFRSGLQECKRYLLFYVNCSCINLRFQPLTDTKRTHAHVILHVEQQVKEAKSLLFVCTSYTLDVSSTRLYFAYQMYW